MSIKDKLNHPIAILLMIVAFLTLTAIAAVEYNSDRPGAEEARQGALYRVGGACLAVGERLFGFLLVGPSEQDQDEINEDKKDNIALNRRLIAEKGDDGSWQLVLKNSEGVIRSVSLKNIFKRSSLSE